MTAAASEARSAFAAIPFTRLLGVRREFSEGGRARMVLDERVDFGNVVGAVHGGVTIRNPFAGDRLPAEIEALLG